MIPKGDFGLPSDVHFVRHYLEDETKNLYIIRDSSGDQHLISTRGGDDGETVTTSRGRKYTVKTQDFSAVKAYIEAHPDRFTGLTEQEKQKFVDKFNWYASVTLPNRVKISTSIFTPKTGETTSASSSRPSSTPKTDETTSASSSRPSAPVSIPIRIINDISNALGNTLEATVMYNDPAFYRENPNGHPYTLLDESELLRNSIVSKYSANYDVRISKGKDNFADCWEIKLTKKIQPEHVKSELLFLEGRLQGEKEANPYANEYRIPLFRDSMLRSLVDGGYKTMIVSENPFSDFTISFDTHNESGFNASSYPILVFTRNQKVDEAKSTQFLTSKVEEISKILEARITTFLRSDSSGEAINLSAIPGFDRSTCFDMLVSLRNRYDDRVNIRMRTEHDRIELIIEKK